MKYTPQEIIQYTAEEDVKFIRLAFCDVYGKQKNISIMPSELERAFEQGIGFDASAVRGFGNEARSDLMLFPDPDTLSVLPWRPEHGRVVRMFCSIKKPNDQPFECDTRSLLLRFCAGILPVQARRERQPHDYPLRYRRIYGHSARGQG